MKIYNEEKTVILDNYDPNLGHLVVSTLDVPEVQAKEEEGHYEILAEYPNGGKEQMWVVDKPAIEYSPTHTEDIYIYVPYTPEELEQIELDTLRQRRETECFSIINRGQFWYDLLTKEQKAELRVWYQNWLDVTDTKVIPTKPSWLD